MGSTPIPFVYTFFIQRIYTFHEMYMHLRQNVYTFQNLCIYIFVILAFLPCSIVYTFIKYCDLYCNFSENVV